MEDLDIIALYWERNEAAIRETDSKYGAFCRSLSMNILSIREDAEECVNDTYQKTWNSIPPERPGAFRVWLGRIVRNLSINRWYFNRAQKRYAGAEELLSELGDCIPDAGTTEEILEAQELSNYISEWLDTLPAEERGLFIRRYWYGDQLKKLAADSGCSPGNLAGRMFRLRKSLRDRLTAEGVSV